MENPVEMIFFVVALLMAAVLHELAHALTAERLGDPTARRLGRITLSPIAHIDPFGSIILPFILVVTHAPILFGWAKPVPVQP
ncbi:MAG: site-2 protease family protein, partial [Deltaproteobacteria bacterium]